MHSVAVSHSCLPDPALAAAELVERASRPLSGEPRLAILFATTDYDIATLVGSVQARLGQVPLWGGTSSTGVFASDGWITGDTGAATLMLIANRACGSGVSLLGHDPVAAGKVATDAALQQGGGSASALLTMSFMGPEEPILAGMAQAAPGIPIVGGSASDHSPANRWQQFGAGRSHSGAVTVAALGGPAGCAFLHGYRLTGRRAVITKASGRRLLELDRRPALDVYAEWTGQNREAVSGWSMLTYSVFHPLLLHVQGHTLAIHPVSGNSDGSIDAGAQLPEGATLELGEGNSDELLANVDQTVRAAAVQVRQPEAVILAHCGGRALGLDDRIREVPNQVRNAVGEVPWVGFLAFGEQGCPTAGAAAHANLSLSALVLGRD